jgi:fatty-acyl-CoA synthase
VGDAFARPLCDELEKGGYSPASLAMVITGGATTSPTMKQRFIGLLPSLFIADAVGSSETGSQLNNLATSGGEPTTTFSVVPGTCVVDETMTYVLEEGHEGIGWLAKSGAIPLGYLGDEEKTKRTFPVVAGQRMVVPGDRARLLEGGLVELLGRESVTINSGGEKIFAEEVEQAIVRHQGVDDVLVVGRPNERWGQEIVAVLQLQDGASPSDKEILALAGERIASYKLPKLIVRVGKVERSPSGKPDYAWARQVAIDAG